MNPRENDTELTSLRKELAALRQERDDLSLALVTAVEHGDAIEEQTICLNEQLKREIRERQQAESWLQVLTDRLSAQNADLEALVTTITEHSDQLDFMWFERYTHVERMSMADPLTRIANRRAFNTALEREWKRSVRGGTPLGLVMCDVDWFKKFNDQYGHVAGDECLVKVARALAACCHRPDDLAARYGGEEFAMILPLTELEGVRTMAEQVREQVHALAIPHALSPHGVVTVSLGGVSWKPGERHTQAELLSSADHLLYQAKREGRDTIRIGIA